MKGKRAKANQLELEVKAKLKNLAVIGDFIAEAMKQLGVDQEIFRIQLAVDEACTNIIEHAYSGESEKLIRLTCAVSGNDFVIQIRDWGKPFDTTVIQVPQRDSDLFERELGGLGVFLMRQTMDDVRYVFRAKKYNELTMIKHLS
jgi:serine/threonine-protein kinase RsbW